MALSSEPDAASRSPLASTSTSTSTAEEKPSPENEKVFELHISTTIFDHDKYLNSPATNPLHGPYQPASPATSYIASSLDEVIPPSLWAAGLKDWETDGFRLTARDRGTPTPDSEARPEQGQGHMRTGIEWKVSQRERKRQGMAVPEIMKGLRPMKEAYEKREQVTNDASFAKRMEKAWKY